MKPIRVAHTPKISRAEWLNLRKQGIGGSDASAVVGLNPYASKYSLWADKMGLLPDKEDTEAMRVGRDLEDYVARRFEEATGKKVRKDNFMYRSGDHPFMLANIDRTVMGENAALECKTTSALNRTDYAGGEIPRQYYCQMMHYMAVMGYDRMYLAVVVLGKGFYWFTVERDENEIEALIAAEQAFWDLVQEGIPPELDGSEATAEAMNIVYGVSDSKEVADLTGFDRDYATIRDCKEQIETLSELKAESENRIKAAIGNLSKGCGGTFKASWAEEKRTTVDGKRLKADHPELYQAYAKTSTSRVFRLSAIK